MKKISFHTIGCRLNQAETAVLTDQVIAKGYQLVDFGQPTDVLVLNTCSVTEGAEADCRRIVRRTLKHSPQAFVAITGCYAQTGEKTLKNVPGVDLILGNQYKMSLPDYLNVIPIRKASYPHIVHSRTLERNDFLQEGIGNYSTTRANLKIQDGCNFMCSFCLIPFSRGRERSRYIDDAIREAEQLVERGHRELVLTGVNIGQFKSGGSNLIDLFERLESIKDLERIRISSIEPTTIPDELLDYMVASKKLCRFLHVPLQSGDDQILQSMHRRYSVKEYIDWIHRVIEKIPEICIGTDLMVGFPGESEQQFSNTLAIAKDLPFAYFHVFSYSPRPRTSATYLNNCVENGVIKNRNKKLTELSRRKRLLYYQKFLNQSVSVLFESRGAGALWTGLTENYIKVGVASSEFLTNQIKKVCIVGMMDGLALGQLINDSRERLTENLFLLEGKQEASKFSDPVFCAPENFSARKNLKILEDS